MNGVFFSFSFCHYLWDCFFGEIQLMFPEFLNYKKKVIRIISGVGFRNSRRGLFRELDILPLSCEYILFYVVCDR